MHTKISAETVVDLDARAVRASVELVAQAGPGDWSRPTPCVGWTLHGLVAHMATQHWGFAAAAHGDGDPARWRLRALGDDPVQAYRRSADAVLAAFAEPDVLDRRFPLPEITLQSEPYPAAQAIAFHLVDYVAHAWDVAATLGLRADLDADVLDAALEVARLVPGGDQRTAPGAAFGPELPFAAGSPLDELLTRLGRSPSWPN